MSEETSNVHVKLNGVPYKCTEIVMIQSPDDPIKNCSCPTLGQISDRNHPGQGSWII